MNNEYLSSHIERKKVYETSSNIHEHLYGYVVKMFISQFYGSEFDFNAPFGQCFVALTSS